MAKRKNDREHEKRGDTPKDDDVPENTENEQEQGNASVPAPPSDGMPRKKLRPKARVFPKEGPGVPKFNAIGPFAQLNFGGQYQAAVSAPASAPAPAAASSGFMALLQNVVGPDAAAARPPPATGTNNDDYFRDLRGLNESFRKAISEVIEKDVGADLQKLFDQYTKHRKDIDAKKATNANRPAATTEAGFGAVAPPPPPSATQGGLAAPAFGSAAAPPTGFGVGFTIAVPSEAPAKSPAPPAFQFAAPKSPSKSPAKSPAAAAPAPAPTPAPFSFNLGGAGALASGASAAPSAFSFGASANNFAFGAAAAPAPAPAATTSSFKFGTPAATTSPFKFGAPAASTPATTAGNGDGEGEGDEGEPQDDNPDAAEESVPEFLANADANLADIFSVRVVLQEQLDKNEWKKVGVDTMRLVRYNDTGKVALLMRVGLGGAPPVINASPSALFATITRNPKILSLGVVQPDQSKKQYLVQAKEPADIRTLADKIAEYKSQ
ncbi:hypothetical protein AMAG_04772 [Allomyces macrogynus ATCC 38327]|uniref:RanBD1 domain-containing protein n=1 Tax=Allomyces macrogynus (strain ATCC 38327) TaxID=578462 RepID=A0A0L0S604_ALLM3|nr:hypothetical protein AMAG_04772 [Allomyces macrogynus ATCC 38327]|eukprot:KNE57937.1 hypothetical protein AMAG_04772 [Allomyces macrogynus ATCC 38327]